MKAIWGPTILVAALSAGCSTPPAKEMVDTTDLADAGVVRETIESNWNISYEAAEACPEPFQLQVMLKPGGVVQSVALNRALSNSDACRSLVESARRAVMISSPLPVPDDVTKLNINFNIPAVLEAL